MRKRPKALDLFCCAGGASMGLHRAGFDVTGVDIRPQPRYPFKFIQGDALTVSLEGYDFIWASPPCQRYSQLASRWLARLHQYPDLIAPVRKRLIASGLPFVIENVKGAPLLDPLMLCGTMFGLISSNNRELQRHRLFEANGFTLRSRRRCNHQHPVVGVYGHTGGRELRRGSTPRSGIAERREVMGIDWMNRDELSQSIPPIYSEFIGRQVARLI